MHSTPYFLHQTALLYFHLLLIISTTVLFSTYFAKDNQSPRIKTLLINKSSHLFWEGLLF